MLYGPLVNHHDLALRYVILLDFVCIRFQPTSYFPGTNTDMEG